MKGLTGISCKGKLTLKIAKNKVIIRVPYLNLSFAMTPDTDCRVPRLHVEQSQGSPEAASAFRRQPNPPRVDHLKINGGNILLCYYSIRSRFI